MVVSIRAGLVLLVDAVTLVVLEGRFSLGQCTQFGVISDSLNFPERYGRDCGSIPTKGRVNSAAVSCAVRATSAYHPLGRGKPSFSGGRIFPAMKEQDEGFLHMAIAASRASMEQGDGGPFGCVIVKDGQVVGRGNNRVTSTNDPTAHAEMVAIRDACKNLSDFQLTGCTIYTSCEPCPMCLGAIYWARPDRIVYAATQQDAAAAGFDDQFIYDELALPTQERRINTEGKVMHEEANKVFLEWIAKGDKALY